MLPVRDAAERAVLVDDQRSQVVELDGAPAAADVELLGLVGRRGGEGEGR